MSLSDRRYGNAGAAFQSVDPRVVPAGHLDNPFLLRMAFLAACALAAAAAVYSAGTDVAQSADPDLDKLLRGMAIIKSVILLFGGAAIWWRLGSAIRPSIAAGYIFCAAIATGGAALVWNIAHLAIAPFLFDGGLLAFLILALRDDNGPWLRSLTRARARRNGGR